MNNAKGVDLSHFQPAVQFHEMAVAGIEFVGLKATEGLSFTDPTFADYRTRANKSGLRIRGYHFLHPLQDAGEQAAHFKSVYGNLRAGDLPPVVDVEQTPGWDQLPIRTRGSKVIHYGLSLHDAYQVKPTVYCSMGWLRGMFDAADIETFARLFDLWAAHYGPKIGDISPWTTWQCWQNAEHGTVPGAGNGNIDTDIWNGPLPPC